MSRRWGSHTHRAVALAGAALSAGVLLGTGSVLAIEDVSCATLVPTDLPAVPGGDAALAGRQPGSAPLTEPGRCWSVAIPLGILLADAVASGPVVVIPDDSGRVVAVTAADGSEAWTYRVADEGEGQVHGLTAGPGSVYVAGPEGLTALDPVDGTRRWRHRVSSDGAVIDAAGSFWPVAQGDALYTLEASTDDDMSYERRLVALDAATGDERWAVPLPVIPGVPSTDGVLVVLAPGDGSLLAVDAVSGERRWVADAVSLRAMPLARPALGEGVVVAGLADGSVVAIDTVSGTVAWRYPGDGVPVASVSVSGESVLVNASTTLTALDGATGSVTWTAPIQASAPMFPLASIPGVTEDTVLVGTTDATDVAAVLALDAATGLERWRVATEAYGAVLSPLVTGGRIVVPVFDLTGSSGLLSLGLGE
jgi:outer membrane protein assembly factor BamB